MYTKLVVGSYDALCQLINISFENVDIPIHKVTLQYPDGDVYKKQTEMFIKLLCKYPAGDQILNH